MGDIGSAGSWAISSHGNLTKVSSCAYKVRRFLFMGGRFNIPLVGNRRLKSV